MAESEPWYCAICARRIEDDMETHIAERHSDPEQRPRDIAGNETMMRDDDYIRLMASTVPPSGNSVDPVTTSVPVPSLLESAGIKMSDCFSAEPQVEGGASLTDTEVKKVFEAVELAAGFKIDRANFLVSALEWGFRTGFSEELTESGGWKVTSAPTVGNRAKYYRTQDLVSAIRDHLAASGSARDFTFRRFGRSFGPQIPTLVANNPVLNAYTIRGTDISNRLGVSPSLFLCCTSIFESIKPYKKWTDDEVKAWTAHNVSVRKTSNDSRRDPADLRIDPEVSSRARDSGFSDMSERMADRYGKGFHMLNRMTAAQRSPGDRSGLQ